MAKSTFVEALDAIQTAIVPLLKERGFRRRGRTFNRVTGDGLTQVVNLQLAPSDPPGAVPTPGFESVPRGLFTINLGVYVPEVAKNDSGGQAGSWVQEYHCCIRARIAEACGQTKDIWWPAQLDPRVVRDVRSCLEQGGLQFLGRYETRANILSELSREGDRPGVGSSPPRIVMAIIHVERGEADRARRLLARQALETGNPGHPRYVRELAAKLGLGAL